MVNLYIITSNIPVFYIPLWFIRFWRVFIFSITLSGITSTVLLSMTNTTQWIWSDNCGLVTKPAVSDELNWEREKSCTKKLNRRKCFFFLFLPLKCSIWPEIIYTGPMQKLYFSGDMHLHGSFIHLKVKSDIRWIAIGKQQNREYHVGTFCLFFFCLLFVFSNFLAQLKRLMKETHADSTALISYFSHDLQYTYVH